MFFFFFFTESAPLGQFSHVRMFVCLSVCSKSFAAYKLECQESPKSKLSAVYHGETGRNVYSRGLEHLAGVQNKKEDNQLWKHCLLQHNGQQVIESNFHLKSSRHCPSQAVRACHLSRVTCELSHVTCHVYFFCFVFGTSRWRVCYQLC